MGWDYRNLVLQTIPMLTQVAVFNTKDIDDHLRFIRQPRTLIAGHYAPEG